MIGRIGVDLTPSLPRTSLASAVSFSRAVGGFAGNIGTGLARLGVATAVVSSVGDDGHGQHVRTFLAGEGINVESIVTRLGARTQVAFFEAWPPERFPVTFYRPAPAPDSQMTEADLPTELIERAPLAIVSGALLAAEPARSTTLRLLEGRRASRHLRTTSWTILDLDWRPTLWADPNEAPALVRAAARLADVLIGSDEEFEAAHLQPEVTTGGGPQLIVLKHGPAGASLLAAAGGRRVPGIPVEVVCGLGAGDALSAAFAAGLLGGLDPAVALERGNAAGAIVASRLMCSSAMPTPAEIDQRLGEIAGRPQEAAR